MARWGPFPWYFMTTSYTQVQESQKNLSRKPLRVFTGLQRGWTHETKMNLYQFNGNIKQWRRRETSSWCETSMHHLCGIGMYGWQWNWITKAAGWILKCMGVFSLLTFTQLLYNWSDSARLKSYCKTSPRVSQGKEIWYSSVARSVTWSLPIRSCFSVIKVKSENRKTDKQGVDESGFYWRPDRAHGLSLTTIILF